jgi:AcrR family transcriptional regulator
VTDPGDRIREAMLDLVCEQGFESTSIDQVVQRAVVSQETFDGFYGSKEDCAMAVFDLFLADYKAKVEAAFAGEAQWPDSLRAAAYAVADWMVSHPREVRFGTVEMLWATEMAQARREEGFQTFVKMVDAGRERAADPGAAPEFTADGVVGSIAVMLTKELQRSGRLDPHKFVPEMMYLAVLPFMGQDAAARELTIPRPASSTPRRTARS